MKALVLDFDGVISDSAGEAFTVALRTYLDLEPASPLSASGREELFREFVVAMPLGNRAEDFGAVLAALERERPLPDQQAYDLHRAGLSTDWLADYHRHFYEVRDAIKAAGRDDWLGLMRPYRPFVELLRRRAGELPYAIATARDRASVEPLIESYGVADLFPSRLILDKDTGPSKTVHLERLGRLLDLEPHEMTFVDDKLNHLDAVGSLGVRCALAAWGYNAEREYDEAARRGHLVCRLDDAEALLFGD